MCSTYMLWFNVAKNGNDVMDAAAFMEVQKVIAILPKLKL